MGQSEIWKDIKGWKGYYQASSKGRIRSLTRTIEVNCISKLGISFVRKKIIHGCILTPCFATKKYHLVILSKEGVCKTIKKYKLVANAFVKRIPGKEHINHKNGIKTDDRIENLERVNSRENNSHKTLTMTNKTSAFVGVSWDKQRSMWVSFIKIDGKSIYLGASYSEKAASKMYKRSLRKNHLVNKYS